MPRFAVIDGLRGYFLTMMTITHLAFTGGYLLYNVNHAQLGFVQDAQGFVFLSGLLVGMVYGRRMLRHGFADPAARMWRRALILYLAMIGLIVAVLAMRAVLPGAEVYWGGWLGALPSENAVVWLATAAMLYEPAFFDILPQYILYLAVAPPLLWLALNGRGSAVLAASAALWLAIQFGLHLPIAGYLDRMLSAAQPGLALRSAFDPFAWQIVFVSALTIGALSAAGRFPLARCFDARRPGPAVAAALVVLFFAVWRLGFTFGLPDPVTGWFRVFENRPDFSLVFILNFIALGYLVAWLLIAGSDAAGTTVRRVAAALTRLFTLSFFRLLGRHSLLVYCWHVLLVYAVAWVDGRYGRFHEVTKTAIALCAVAALAIPPLLSEWRAQRRSPGPVREDAAPAAE